MSKLLYSLSRVIAVYVVFNGIYNLGRGFNSSRNTILIIELILFLMISYMYQRKRTVFTPTYLIYYFIIFFINGYFPYTYPQNHMMLGTVVRNKYARIPSDNFELLFYIVLIISIFILFYLLLTPRIRIKFEGLKTNDFEIKSVFVSMLILAPIQYILSGNFRKLLIPFFVYFVILFFYSKDFKKNKLIKIGFYISILVLSSQITWRFIAVQYLFPIVLAMIVLETLIKKNLVLKRYVFYVIGGFIIILLYGITSEMYKLGAIEKISDIFSVFTNKMYLDMWIERQTYRIFGIWTVLGGNIIDNTKEVGYYYGLTYIKFFANFLGFEYISLPLISANFVGATYAQPGLIAEGYANFGIIGSVLNFCTVLFLSEWTFIKFINKQSALNFLLMIVPFTSVVFDGGSLNSVLFSIIVILMTLWGAVIVQNYSEERKIL